jgi:hypothetical protein
MPGSTSRKSKKTAERGSPAAAQALVPPKSFPDYFLGTFLRPRRTFDALMADPRRLRFGFFAVAIAAVLYTLIYVFLTMAGGAPSTFTPFLAIPKESYYSANRFILAPSMVMCWVLAAGVAQLLSRLFAGKGTFEDMLSLFGFSIGISTLISALHDFPDSLLGALGVLDMKWYEVALNSPTIWRTIWATIYGLSFAYFFVLFPKAVGAAQRMRRGPAIFIGVLVFLLYQGVFLIFNR